MPHENSMVREENSEVSIFYISYNIFNPSI